MRNFVESTSSQSHRHQAKPLTITPGTLLKCYLECGILFTEKVWFGSIGLLVGGLGLCATSELSESESLTKSSRAPAVTRTLQSTNEQALRLHWRSCLLGDAGGNSNECGYMQAGFSGISTVWCCSVMIVCVGVISYEGRIARFGEHMVALTSHCGIYKAPCF